MARKNVTPLRPGSLDPAAEKLNDANLRLIHIRAISDLVANSDHDALYDWTIAEALYVVMEEAERAAELIDGVFQILSSRKEVANG